MEEVVRLLSTGDCVRIWDVVAMAPLEQFNPHSSTHTLTQACWSSNNQYVVTASSSGDKVVVSSLKSTPVPVVELAEGKQQTRVCLSSSSKFLASGGLDRCVHIWDLKNKTLHRSLKDHKEEVTCVSFNCSDSFLVSGSSSGDLVLHSLTTNLSSKAFGHGSSQPIRELRVSPLRRSLLGSVSDGGAVVLWDGNAQRELHCFPGAHRAPATGVAFSPASELLLVSVGLDKKVVCYDTTSKILLKSIRVDAPLTAVDFTPDGTGLVVGSTQGKIYQYDLRNSSTPIRVTAAHKTSVTCLRFHSNPRPKSSKMVSTKIGSTKRSSTKLSNSQPDSSPCTGPAPPRQVTSTGGAGVEAEGQQESLPVLEKFSSVGRNSLDIFSPAREDSRTSDAPFARTHVTGLEMLSRDAEGPPVVGRASLDVFSPVREELHSSGSHRKASLTASGRCFSPLTALHTPPPIREEEHTEPCDPTKVEGDGQTPPTSSQPTNHSPPALPFFTPEPGLRRANGIQAQLSYDSPAQAPPTTSAGLSAAVSSLSSNISEVVGQTAPLSSLQIHFIQNMIHETLEDFRDSCHRDVVNLQVEMVRQFYIQLNEIHGLIEKYSVNEALVEEVERLREENRRLRTNY